MINRIKTLFKHQGFKKYFANISWLFAEKILRMIVGLFVGIWVARYLGPDKFGLLSYAQSFVGIFSAIATLGLDGIVVREFVKYPEKENELLGTAFILKLFGAFLTLIILYIAIHFTSNDRYTNILIFIIASATIFQAFNVIDMYFQSKVMSKYIVFTNSFTLLLSSFVKILLIFNKAPLIAFAGMVVFDSLVMSLGYIYWYLKVKKEIFFIKFNIAIAKQLLKSSFPLILSSISVVLYMRVDQIMIKELLNNKAVGNYAVAVRLSEIWYFIPGIIINSIFPAIINAKKISEKLYYYRFQQLYKIMVILAILISFPISFFSNEIINILYGSQYNEASSVLKIHIWTSLFVFLGLVSSKWFIIEHIEKYSFYRTILGLLLNIILNIILIPIFKIKGAAIATLISQIFTAYIFDIFTIKTRNMFFIKTKALLLKD